MAGIEITRACNLTCPHCFTAAGRRPGPELSTTELREVIDQLLVIGPPRAIGWTGGEPLLREDLEELAAYAKTRGNIASGITTNGLLLTEARAERMRKSGVYAVQISIDGSTPERYAKMRNGQLEDFEKILAAMTFVKKHGMQLHLAMLLCSETIDDGRAFLEFAAKLGADGVRFCGFVPAGRGRNDKIRQRLEFDDLTKLREFVTETQSHSALTVMFDPAFGPLPPDFDYHECVAGTSTMYIDSYGWVYPCTSLIHERFRVGNVKNEPLEAIWANSKMTEIAHFDHSEIEEPCSGCRHFDRCHGGCRGIAFAQSGTLSAAFANCLHSYSLVGAAHSTARQVQCE